MNKHVKRAVGLFGLTYAATAVLSGPIYDGLQHGATHTLASTAGATNSWPGDDGSDGGRGGGNGGNGGPGGNSTNGDGGPGGRGGDGGDGNYGGAGGGNGNHFSTGGGVAAAIRSHLGG